MSAVAMRAGSTVRSQATTRPSLRTYRLNLMRVGYLLMAVGLAVTRWPMLGGAASLPGYRRPRKARSDIAVRMLPLLESRLGRRPATLHPHRADPAPLSSMVQNA